MPGGAHPWMDPARETRLWPHEDNEIYEAFDRIFGCTGHGWSNLQCVHLNLPFDDDENLRACTRPSAWCSPPSRAGGELARPGRPHHRPDGQPHALLRE